MSIWQWKHLLTPSKTNVIQHKQTTFFFANTIYTHHINLPDFINNSTMCVWACDTAKKSGVC